MLENCKRLDMPLSVDVLKKSLQRVEQEQLESVGA
jgi:hypothetical protein